MAQKCSAAGDAAGASRLHERCLDAARSAGEAASEARAALALGESLVDASPNQAIQMLEVAEGLCRKLGDIEGEGSVCAALAAAWRLKGDDERAADYLDRRLRLADATDDLHAQAEACRTLGALHSARGDFDSAVALLSRNFAITRTLLARGRADAALVDGARVQLGIAVGNASRDRYVETLKTDFPALLAWKNSRAALPSGEDAAARETAAAPA